VVAAGIAGGTHPQLARRVTAEKITAQHAVFHDHATLCLHAFVIERAGSQAFRDVRHVGDVDVRGEDGLVELIEQERGLAIQAAAAYRIGKAAQQTRGDRRFKQYRHLHGL
jgi:hypothetical protein